MMRRAFRGATTASARLRSLAGARPGLTGRALCAAALLALGGCDPGGEEAPSAQTAGLEQGAGATTYHVAIGGSDVTGNGTSSAPWRTVRHAASKVPAAQGHTIRVGPGVFDETDGKAQPKALPIVLPPGVNLIGAGIGATTLAGAVIQGVSTTLTAGLQRVSGFTLTGKGRVVGGKIHFERRSQVEIDHIEARDCEASGIDVYGGPSNRYNPPTEYVTGIKLHDLTLTRCGKALETYHEGALVVGGLQGGEIRNVTIDTRGTRGYGIKMKDGGGFKGTKFRDLTITVDDDVPAPYEGRAYAIELMWLFDDCEIARASTNNTISVVYGGRTDEKKYGSSVRIHDSQIIQRERGAAGVSLKPYFAMELSIHDAVVDHNYIVNPGDWGISSWPGTGSPWRNLYVRHNVVVGGDVDPATFVFTRGTTNMHILHNTVYNVAVAVDSQASRGGQPIIGTDVRNNVFAKVRGKVFGYCCGGEKAVHDGLRRISNVYTLEGGGTYVAQSGDQPTRVDDRGNAKTDPGLTLKGVRPYPYFAPASVSSYVVDRGVVIGSGFPHLGAGPDIGAYEFDPMRR